MENDEFLQDLTLSQVLPGPNFSNLAVALGYRLAGLRGAAWALLAVVLPGALVLMGLAAAYGTSGLGPHAASLMRGMAAAVVGLVLVTTLRLVRASLETRRAALIAALTFTAVGPLHVNTALVLVVMTAVSFALNRGTLDEAHEP